MIIEKLLDGIKGIDKYWGFSGFLGINFDSFYCYYNYLTKVVLIKSKCSKRYLVRTSSEMSTNLSKRCSEFLI